MFESDFGSITRLLPALKSGDPEAQQELWNRYMEQLIRMACTGLAKKRTQFSDAEDIVLKAYEDFLKGVADNRFSKLDGRSDVWQILVMLTSRRAIERHRYQKAEKRGGNQVRTESFFDTRFESHPQQGIHEIAGSEPTPEFAAMLHDEVLSKLAKLNDNTKRAIIVFKLKGLSTAEIAGQLNISNRSVQRKLQLIYETWTENQDS